MRVRRRIHLHLRVHVDVHPPPAMYSRLSKSWLQDLRGFGIRGTACCLQMAPFFFMFPCYTSLAAKKIRHTYAYTSVYIQAI